MQKALYISLLLQLLFFCKVQSQCGCTNCPFQTVSNSTVFSTINVNGATSDQLGVDGQDLVRVCFSMISDAIEELNVTLTSPDGSVVQLIQASGIGIGQNISFDICFIPCSEMPSPEPGFSPNFNTADPWMNNTGYGGCYLPPTGNCFENLIGDVNGPWTLQLNDNISSDDTDILDWFLVFADNDGTTCTNSPDCMPQCIANAGNLGADPEDFCIGDITLLAPIPDYPNPNLEPPVSDYGYYYILTPADGLDLVLSISNPVDISGFAAGTYNICGYSYLLTDEPLIPTVDGSLTIADLNTQITNGDICADLSNGCKIFEIFEMPPVPVFTGPDNLCLNEIGEYIVSNNADGFELAYQLGGVINFFNTTGDEVSISWSDGPAQICADFTNICGTTSTCIDVNLQEFLQVDLDTGPLVVCAGESGTYTFIPEAPPNSMYEFLAIGGTILSQNGNEVTIEWVGINGSGELCASITGDVCGVPGECQNITVEGDLLPALLDVELEYCENEIGIASIIDNPTITSYTWGGTGITITNGQGSNEIEFTFNQIGLVTVCLNIEGDCGIEGPLCEDIEVFSLPEPVIIGPDQICENSFELTVTQTNGGDILWTNVVGPGATDILSPNSSTTTVNAPNSGLYTFEVEVTNGQCVGIDIITVEILPPLEFSTPMIDCDVDGMFTVTFEILNGTSPYFVSGVELLSTLFTSTSFISGSSFNFQVFDELGCTGTISGAGSCGCLTDAGSVTGLNSEICLGENINPFVTLNGDFVFDGNDIDMFILHDGTATTIGNIFDQNETGIFDFVVGMNFGQMYFITYIVGNDDGSGNVDQNDPCFDAAEGFPVTFYEQPSISYNIQYDGCLLETEIIGSVTPSFLSINWSTISGPAALNFVNSDLPITVFAPQAGTYEIQIEVENGACILLDTIEIEFVAPLEATNIEITCLPDLENYIVTFEIIGGIQPLISNADGTFNGNVFTSDPIPNGQPYFILVWDDSDCQILAPVQGVFSCDIICTSDAGVIQGNNTEICISSGESVVSILSGDFIPADQIGHYILHDGTFDNIGNILDQNDIGVFFYNTNLSPGQIYFITFIVGFDDGSGNVNQNGQCFEAALGYPVTFNSDPIIINITETCLPDFQNYIVTFEVSQGAFPFSTSLPGIFVGNLFTSDLIPSGQSYNAIVTDANNCSSVETSGSKDCNCISDAGTIDEVAIVLCPSDSLIVLVSNGDFVIGTGDTLLYVLHTSSTMILGDVKVISKGEKIGFDLNILEYDSVYFLSVVIGNQLGIFIDFNDPCLSISLGIPVLWQPVNEFLFETQTISQCIGDSAIISFDVTGQLPIFVNLINDDGVLINYPIITSPGLIKIPIENDTNFWVVDGIQGVCTEVPLDTIFTLGKEPSGILINDVLRYCNSDYVLISELNSYTLGTAQGEFVFPTEFIIKGDSVFFNNNNAGVYNIMYSTIGLDEPCPGDLFNFSITLLHCACVTNVGTVNQNAISLCEEDSLDVLISNLDYTFDSDDSIAYILHTENSNEFGIILAISFSEKIGFDPIAMNFNTTYYLSAVAGNYLNGAIILNDTCLSISAHVPVTWLENNVLVFDQKYFMGCDGDTAFASYIYSGLLPNTLSLQDEEGEMINYPITTENGILPIVFSADTTFYLSSLFGLCSSSIFDTLFLEGSSSESIDFIVQEIFPVVCADEQTSINLNELITPTEYSISWFAGNSSISSQIEIYNPSNSLFDTTFSYRVMTDNNCSSTEGEVIIRLLPIPIFDALPFDVSCFGIDDGEILIDITNNQDGPYDCFINGIQLETKEIEGLISGIYKVHISNIFGCLSDTLHLKIDQPDPLVVTLGDNLVIEIYDTVTIVAILNIIDSDISVLRWEDLAGIINDQDLTLIKSFAENDIIKIFIEDDNGCIAEDSIFITVREDELPGIHFLPNVFTPNGDQMNDVFGVFSDNQIELIKSFAIFDRWGNKVFYVEDELPNTEIIYWDGNSRGQEMNPGVFVYKLHFISKQGNDVFEVGDVLLLR